MDIPLTGLAVTELFCFEWRPSYKICQIHNISESLRYNARPGELSGIVCRDNFQGGKK